MKLIRGKCAEVRPDTIHPCQPNPQCVTTADHISGLPKSLNSHLCAAAYTRYAGNDEEWQSSDYSIRRSARREHKSPKILALAMPEKPRSVGLIRPAHNFKFAHAIPSSPMAAMGCPGSAFPLGQGRVFTSGGSL